MGADAARDTALPLVGESAVDATALREVMRSFATGITIVTTRQGGVDYGMTVNSLTSVSLEPPLVLVCLKRGTRTLGAVRAAGSFAVTILSEDQWQESNRFARPIADRFHGVDVTRDAAGLPVLSSGLAHLRCAVYDTHDGGDHEIIVGRVRDAASRDGRALVFYDGRYAAVDNDVDIETRRS